MPRITVNVIGGTDKENLRAVIFGGKRWGNNGSSWGTSQDVSVGQATIVADYSGKETVEGQIDVQEDDTVLNITADGPAHTACALS